MLIFQKREKFVKLYHTFCYNSKSVNSNELSVIFFVPLTIGWDHYLCEMSGYLLSQQKLRAQAWWLIKTWHRKSDALRIVAALSQTSSYWFTANADTFESLFYVGLIEYELQLLIQSRSICFHKKNVKLGTVFIAAIVFQTICMDETTLHTH